VEITNAGIRGDTSRKIAPKEGYAKEKSIMILMNAMSEYIHIVLLSTTVVRIGCAERT
jgi:hypothetical protein